MAGIAFKSQKKQEKQEKQEKQDANNKKFLVDFLIPFSQGQDSSFIPKFSNLLEQAWLAAQHKPFKLYNKSTYWEFHHLLLDMLHKFWNGLQTLQTSASKSMELIQDENTENELQFGDYLSAVILIGYGL